MTDDRRKGIEACLKIINAEHRETMERLANGPDDLISRLREHITVQEWPTLQDKAADALEEQARRIAELEEQVDAWEMDGGHAAARIAELEAQNEFIMSANNELSWALKERDEATAHYRTLQARIAELEAVNAANQSAIQSNVDVFDEGMKKLIALCDTKDARISELEAALKPFADLAQYYDGCAGEYRFYARIKPNDLRAARAALEKK